MAVTWQQIKFVSLLLLGLLAFSGCASKTDFTPLEKSLQASLAHKPLPETHAIQARGRAFWSGQEDKLNFNFVITCLVDQCRILASHPLGPTVAEIKLEANQSLVYLPQSGEVQTLYNPEIRAFTPEILRKGLWQKIWAIKGWKGVVNKQKIKLTNKRQEKLILLIQKLELGEPNDLNFSADLQ